MPALAGGSLGVLVVGFVRDPRVAGSGFGARRRGDTIRNFATDWRIASSIPDR
jgi:hypothetical protein